MQEGPLRGGAFAGALVAFALAGALLGLASGFLAGAGPRVGPVLLSVGAILGIAGTPALVIVVCRLSGRSGAGAAPYGAWLFVVLLLSMRHRWDPALNFAFHEVPVLVYGGAALGSIACGLGALWVPRPAKAPEGGHPALEAGEAPAEEG